MPHLNPDWIRPMDESNNEVVTISDEGAFDSSNPKSLYSLLSATYQEHLNRVKNSFLGDASEWERRREIKHLNEYPMIRKLRQSFWIEFDNALKANRKMAMVNVWGGITLNLSEFNSIISKDHYAAFIFTKPVAKESKERALLELAYEQIEEILGTSHLNKDGIMNPASAKLKVEIWKHLDERVHGGVVKQVQVRSEQKSLNVNVNSSGKDSVPQIEINKASELKERLKELREQTRDLEAIETSGYILDD
jgi:hypothetical protein